MTRRDVGIGVLILVAASVMVYFALQTAVARHALRDLHAASTQRVAALERQVDALKADAASRPPAEACAPSAGAVERACPAPTLGAVERAYGLGISYCRSLP